MRKRLQAVAEPKRSLGPGTGWWVHKKHLPLATDDELLGNHHNHHNHHHHHHHNHHHHHHDLIV